MTLNEQLLLMTAVAAVVYALVIWLRSKGGH
jgi:hypothetical protein